MRTKSTVAIILVIFAIVSIGVVAMRETGVIPGAKGTGGTQSSASTQDRFIAVYYFHGTVRCPTCLKIEHYADSTLKATFADELQDGRMIWKSINMDEEPNKHFVADYDLYSQTLIVIDSTKGQPSHWKNLEKIWELVGDQGEFSAYVRNEVDSYLKEM